MAKFEYTASTADGKVVEGELEVQSGNEVLAFLASRELKPISIRLKKESNLKRGIYFGSAITAADKVFLTKHLALMLSAGTNLFSALDILIADTDKPALKSFLKEIRYSLEKGQPFYTAFARYSKYFSPVFINLIKAGEVSGTLEKVFNNLSQTLERQENLRKKIKSALTYPILLLIASFLILIFLVTFILPRIAAIFLEGQMKIPVFSKVVFTIGLFLSDYVYWLLGSMAAIAALTWYFFAKTRAGRWAFYQILSHIPVIKKVFKRINIQRFASTLAALMKADVPILDALEVTADSLSDQQMRRSLLRIANEGVAKGLTMGEAFKKEKSFPIVVSSLIITAEKSGSLDEVLRTLSTFYESEIESAIHTMITFIEPIMLVVIGVIVAFIALSVIVPVYQLVGQF